MSSFTSVAELLARLRERAPVAARDGLVELERIAAVLRRMPLGLAVLVALILLALYATKTAALGVVVLLVAVELALRASAARGLAAANTSVGGGRR